MVQTMTLKTLSERELSKAQVCKSGWLTLLQFKTKTGTRDVVRRNNRQTDACKVMPIFLSNKQAKSFDLRGKVKLTKLAKRICSLKTAPHVGILANDRPVTYLKNAGVSQNYLFEYPGGVVEYGEKIKAAGVREMMEELGLKKEQVLCFAKLLPRAAPDQGTHAEWTSFVVAVCKGKMSPPNSEGIVPDKCKEVPLDRIPRFVKKLGRKKIGFECHILSGYNALMMAAHQQPKK